MSEGKTLPVVVGAPRIRALLDMVDVLRDADIGETTILNLVIKQLKEMTDAK